MNNPEIDPITLDGLTKEIAQLEVSGFGITLQMSGEGAFCLIGSLQLVLKHEGLKDLPHVKETIENLATQITRAFYAAPIDATFIKLVIEQGWRTDQ